MSTPTTQTSKTSSQPTTNYLPNYEHLSITRRDGSVEQFDPSRIANALKGAFLEVEGNNAAGSSSIQASVKKITKDVVIALCQRAKSRPNLPFQIEDIQDQVEIALMRQIAGATPEQREKYYQVARAYVLYREEHRSKRDATEADEHAKDTLLVTLSNGQQAPLDKSKLMRVVTEACEGLENVEAAPIVEETIQNLFNGVQLDDVKKSLIMTARTMLEKEPNYNYVTARLLLDHCRFETLPFLGFQAAATQEEMKQAYPKVFAASIKKGVEADLLNPQLQTFDLERLGAAIDASRDFQFTYLGLQTLYDRYFLHIEGNRIELPQTLFMRVAMGLALAEEDKEARAIEFYNLISTFDYMCGTPTLFNSGTKYSQLSSCFLSTVSDDLHSIFDLIKDNALLSKFAGGLGNDWTPIRGLGAHIKGTNGKSLGVVPFLKIANDTAVAVNQGGKRKGALCSYLETWHLDIEEFLELRKNTGDERRRTHDMNTANWIPDLFMKRMIENKDWTLFSPDEVPNLHDLYGLAFEEAYAAYEQKAKEGKIKSFKTISARILWRKMLGMIFETGHPWITFKDPCNLRSPQQHVGVVHSSNLCTEIMLNTSKDEVAVCNLGSVNLTQHLTKDGLDLKKLEKTLKTAVRMLDNVIDLNYYSIPQARRANMRHRAVGLGMMGFQDSLYKLNISYTSDKAVEFADLSMEAISYYTIQASSQLAKERGSYASFEGSLWSQGVLPIDSIERLQEARGMYLDQDRSQTMDWNALRKRVQSDGMRNSNVLAIAPTVTISNICGISQSIEPTYQNLYVKSNLSGEFTILNPYLVADLKALDLWDKVMVNDLKYFNGSVQKIQRIPEALKVKYATSFEIEPKWLIECASRRQKWIDQGQSLNLYINQPSGKKLDILYRQAWLRGLKTTYYLRSLGATDTEKSTLHTGALNAVSTPEQTCAIDDPDCEACQ